MLALWHSYAFNNVSSDGNTENVDRTNNGKYTGYSTCNGSDEWYGD